MPERNNPFAPIYRKCNNGTNEEKYNRIYGGGKTSIVCGR